MSDLLPNPSSPDWAGYDAHRGNHIHDWRTYATTDLRDIWETLTPKQQRIVADALNEVASGEDWDW
jgi:hypothetical protein